MNWMNGGVGSPGTKGCGSRPGGDAYWEFRLLNASKGALRRKSADTKVIWETASQHVSSSESSSFQTANFDRFLTLL